MSEAMKERKEKLFAKAKNGYDVISQQDRDAMEAYCRLYRDYLDRIPALDSASDLNALIEEAAFNDGLTDEQYEDIYRTALYRAVHC